MLVRDLIELLEGCDADMEVHIAYGYGDHWRTTVAPSISQISEGYVEYSDYHQMDRVVDEEDCFDEETGEELENPKTRKVILID